MSEPYYIECGPILYLEDPVHPDLYAAVPNYKESIPAVCSFHDFLRWNYTDSYFCCIKDVVESGSISLGKHFDSMRESIQEIQLKSADMYRIYLHRIDTTSFRLDVVMIAEFMVQQYNGRKYAHKQWYRVQGTYRANGASNFFESVHIYQNDEVPKEHPLSEYLIPYLRKADLDTEADAILHEYYPEVYTSQVPIQAKELAKRMGYTVKKARLSEDDTKLGAVFMQSSTVIYYKNGVKKKGSVKERTILIDTVACKNQNRNISDVIIHECIHVYEHFLFYTMQITYREYYGMEYLGFEELIDQGLGIEQIQWVENQAIHMTPRVKMPLYQVSRKAAEFFKANRNVPESIAYNRVTSAIADFFQTSKIAAKNRLVEIGYDKARGMLQYANNKPVPGYLVESYVKDNQTYTINLDKLLEEYERNEAFRKLLDKGAYIYVEGHLCRNNEKYTWKQNQNLVLSSYARTHMAECCLLFTVRHESEDYVYTPGVLHSNIKKPGKLAYLYHANGDKMEEMQEVVQLLESCPDGFAETFRYHMDNLGFSKTTLADSCYLSERTITRMRTATKKMPQVESIVQASIGMHLYPELTYDMMEKANRRFDPGNSAHRWYRIIIRTMYCETLDTVNQYLIAQNVKPLSEN